VTNHVGTSTPSPVVGGVVGGGGGGGGAVGGGAVAGTVVGNKRPRFGGIAGTVVVVVVEVVVVLVDVVDVVVVEARVDEVVSTVDVATGSGVLTANGSGFVRAPNASCERTITIPKPTAMALRTSRPPRLSSRCCTKSARSCGLRRLRLGHPIAWHRSLAGERPSPRCIEG
jgi:hypothetical protein